MANGKEKTKKPHLLACPVSLLFSSLMTAMQLQIDTEPPVGATRAYTRVWHQQGSVGSATTCVQNMIP